MSPQVIIPECLIDGILYCVLVGGGLLVVFLFVALLMLCFYNPHIPDHMRRG